MDDYDQEDVRAWIEDAVDDLRRELTRKFEERINQLKAEHKKELDAFKAKVDIDPSCPPRPFT